MKTIAIVNQKGGCGKTTTAINLSSCLASLKKRVLLIDMDPQSHASLGLNVKPKELEICLYDVLLSSGEDDGPVLNDILIQVEENLDLVPSNIVLSAFEQKLANAPGRESRLLHSIQRTRLKYDYILIDCPPSVGLISFNALMAAQDVLIPIEPSFFSLHGLGKLIETIQIFTERLGHDIKIHTLVTMFDKRTKMSREILEEVQKHFKENTLETVIHLNVRLKEAASYGMPITSFDKQCVGYRDFMSLSREVIKIPEYEIKEQENKLPGPRLVKNGILFSYKNPDATSLKLVGDFNNWTPDRKSEFQRYPNGVWEKVVPLSPGKYHYKFIVDGEWHEDLANPNYIINEFGGVDSIVEVSPVEFAELMQMDYSISESSDPEVP